MRSLSQWSQRNEPVHGGPLPAVPIPGLTRFRSLGSGLRFPSAFYHHVPWWRWRWHSPWSYRQLLLEIPVRKFKRVLVSLAPVVAQAAGLGLVFLLWRETVGRMN